MRTILLAVALVAAPFFSAPAAATSGDAGTGLDAGDSVDTALAVPLGTFEGFASYPGDDADVFRFDLPEYTGVRFIVTPLTGPLFVHTLADGGYVEGGATVSAEPIEVRAVAYGGTVHLAVHAWTEDVAYRVEATTMARFDVTVTGVSIAPVDPAGILREVSVEVTNHGASHNLLGRDVLRVRVMHDDGSARLLGEDDGWQLAPAETRVFTFRWDTAGEIGDVVVLAEALSPDDDAPGDNALALDARVLAPVASADALNHDRDMSAGDARVQLWLMTSTSAPTARYYTRAETPQAYAEGEALSFQLGFPVLDPLFE